MLSSFRKRHSCLSDVVITDSAGVQPRPQRKPAVTDFGL